MSANSEDTPLWWKQAKWVCLAITAGSLSVLAFILRGLFSNPVEDADSKKPGDGVFPSPPKPVQQAAEQAHEEALIAKAESKVVAEEKKKQLQEIVALTDGKERRKRLAEYLRSL